MADAPILASYSRHFALRQPAAARKRDDFNVKRTSSKRPSPWKLKHAAPSKASLQSHKTLVDAFKQHGMRLCDGTRLNAVGKGIHALGRVPPTVSASVSALYLSQNNLRSLDGIEQFAAVRLLSVGGNLLSCDKEVASLNELAQLRNLNLMGNPLCDQPNYRLRVVAMLAKLQVLDNSDVTKKEREAAPHVAAKDDALRTMVTQNHFDIQKLQRIAQLISLHKAFYGCVLAGVATGRFDRVPSPSEVACNVPLLLRLWKYEDALSELEQEALKVQMLTIITRTHAKLAENPKVKAKEYLLKLAEGCSQRAQRQDGPSNGMKQHVASWEEAYSNVIALQQKTIANLHAVCEKDRKEMVEYLKDLLSMNPSQRNQLVASRRMERNADELETKPPPRQSPHQARAWPESSLTAHETSDVRPGQHQLPPQQQDPDTWDRGTEVAYPSFLPPPPPVIMSQQRPQRERKTNQAEASRYSHDHGAPAQSTLDRKASLRSGDFANRSLGEAIHGFKLRDSAATPPHKPSRATVLPSKIPQVQRVYTMHRRDNVPLPPDLIEKQRPPFHKHCTGNARRQSSVDFRDNAHEMSRSHRDTEVATEFNDSQRRASSAFTREDLDMTSISAISHASSSPPRGRHTDENRYIPIGKSPPNPLAEVHATTQRESTRPSRPSYDEPQASPEQVITAVSANDGRLQELEQREEKYIRALMQSEQRELDLRNNLSSVQRKLASYQRTLAQQLHEREAIKEEVVQRTMAVATPKILKRFFIRWIQFYNWSQQIKHVQRKRCFIVQHDHFWAWRRKVWVQQELRACSKKPQLRMRRVHFAEWVNVTRVSVIAKRNEMLRETRFLSTVFQAWVSGVSMVKHDRKLLQAQRDRVVHNLQRACFREWKRTARYKRALVKVQDLRWQDSRRISNQVAFWSWKLFLYSVARPRQERAAQLGYRVQCRQKRLHFREWRKLLEVGKMNNFRLRRRIWRRWVEWCRRVQTEKRATHTEKIAVAKVFFNAWRTTASEQGTSRWSLNLAKRYVNRRRLRKLWAHWKYFSMAKRKYTQNSTKALKHYFMKLLRASWGLWKERTHTNLLRAKANKYGTLQRQFDAFRTGIRLVRAQKARARMLAHAQKRRQWTLLGRVTRVWREYKARMKRCKQHAQIVAFQQRQGVLCAVWRQWRTLYVANLNHQLKVLRSTYDSAVHEKHELEAHLQAAKDGALSLSDQIEILHERSKGDDQQVVSLEQKLRSRDERTASLENELKRARAAIEHERHAWEDALCEEEEKRESDSVKYRSLAQENQVQQVQMIELKRELEAEKAKVAAVEKVSEDLRAASKDTATSHHAEMSASSDKQKELEREIAELRGHLKEQEREREDTANRLQEYEKRIASTCEAMNEHEGAHERENERIRDECANVEAKWREEQVKNAELSRLLQEKNQLILNMTHRINHVESTAHNGRSDPHPGHEQCDALHGNQEDCGRRDLRMVAQTSCRGHPGANDLDQVCASTAQRRDRMAPRSRSLANKSSKQLVRRPGHVVPVRRVRSDELGSPIETAAEAEEIMIDKHTSKVHEDIRLLQERITKRLEQAPAYAQLPPRQFQRSRRAFTSAPDSPISSCSSLSNEDSDCTTEEHQFVADRVRRARLRRLQTQKQAVIMAVSPAISRVATRAEPTTFKTKGRENVALAANSTKKKIGRKAKVAGDRPLSKTVERKKPTRKQQTIVGHAGRVL
ncbi:hypothetical protein PHYPSEUDO_010493 [Phytophthora pseudosyringae]|uniref:Uncharacterized protein n=1 Tax=Phytophthora pseudosyringae TaxID=221518 RepID=A0A8T1W7N1_9STRA|nr:hypothetical protein PHYPSEUDO_010493 [Phytophthora pseudosyringae]